MVQAYNFIASWQLFPEKGTYEFGERPKSGIYKIEGNSDKKELSIYHTWTDLENRAYAANYRAQADGDLNDYSEPAFADKVQVKFPDSISFEIHFYREGQVILHVVHEIMPNGYLKVVQQGLKDNGDAYTNIEFYHKQFSVLPY